MRYLSAERAKYLIRLRHFRRAYSLLMLGASAIVIVGFCILTAQRAFTRLDQMVSAADQMAVQVQDELNNAQNMSLYVGSIDSIRSLLNQEKLPIDPLINYDSALAPYTGRCASIELFLMRAGKVIVSDHGVSDWDEYPDPEFAAALLSGGIRRESWSQRPNYRKGWYLPDQAVLSYVRALPLYETRASGYVVVNVSLAVLRQLALGQHNPELGACSASLGDIPIVGSAGGGGAIVRGSTVALPVSATYSTGLGPLLWASMPNLLWLLLVLIATAAMMYLAAALISQAMLAPVSQLVERMGATPGDGEPESAVLQLEAVFDSLTDELTNARRTMRENLPLARERLVGELIRTRTSPAARSADLKRCGIRLPHPYFAVIILSLLGDGAQNEQTRLVVRQNVQSVLGALGLIYSTYDEESRTLFLLNAPEYPALRDQLEPLCSLLQTGILETLGLHASFSIGLCLPTEPDLHSAYLVALEQLSIPATDEEREGLLSIGRQGGLAPSVEAGQLSAVCEAVMDQDPAALNEALGPVMAAMGFEPAANVPAARKHATVFACSLFSKLASMDVAPSPDALGALLKKLAQEGEPDKLRQLLEAWCTGLIHARRGLSDEACRYVQGAVDYIRAEYAQRLSVPQIAQAVNLNPIYLNRLFKSVTGKTISDYLNHHRTELACGLMTHGGMSVAEAGAAVGFSEVRSFIRFFKKYYGETPGEFKKRLSQSEPQAARNR